MKNRADLVAAYEESDLIRKERETQIDVSISGSETRYHSVLILFYSATTSIS